LVGVFAIDGGLLYTVRICEKLGVQACRVFSICSMERGLTLWWLLLERKLWDYSNKEEIDGLDIHEHGTNVYND
jgi:Amt family ammonium transporter